MVPFRTRQCCVASVALLLTVTACGDGSEGDDVSSAPAGESHRSAVRELDAKMRTAQQEIRPTNDDPYLGLGYEGEEAFSYASPGGHFRVWWVEGGPHATVLADVEPANGVPDYVELVATEADSVVAELDARGWRSSIDDESIPVSWEVGGDGRFDIYLIDFDRSADGLVARNACRTQLGRTVCSSHMLIENDFAGYGSPSIEEAIGVLTSHEYFHAVQAAYTDELEQWVSEGTATWFEESYNPAQRDFERLANTYFSTPERSLNARNQGPFDGFAYGTAIFFRHLERRYDAALMIDLFERIAAGQGALEALDASLREGYDSDLTQAYQSFAAWNAFTGDRAAFGQGYHASSTYDEVPFTDYDATRGLNWDVSVDPVAAKYAAFKVSGPVRIRLEALADRTLTDETRALVLRSPNDYDVISIEEPAIVLEPGEFVFLSILNASPSTTTTARVAFRNYTPPEPTMEPEDGMDMGQQGMEPDAPVVMEPDEETPEDMGEVIDLPEPEPEPEETCAASPSRTPATPGALLIVALLAGLARRLRRFQSI